MKIQIKDGAVFNYKTDKYEVKDLIYIDNQLVDKEEDVSADIVIDAKDKLILPGIVDLHTHAFPYETALGVYPDTIGVETGSSIIVDAGSTGSRDYDRFKEITESAMTTVYSFINYSTIGLIEDGKELSKEEYIDEEALRRVIMENKDQIRGIKLRASQSVVGDLDMKPLIAGKAFARKMGLPVMVHIGNYPPYLEDVLNILESNDIITHCFHGKDGGILDDNGNVKELVRKKQEEGNLFDVGHGAASFNLEVASKAIEQGFIPYTISTDVHARNFKKKVYNIAEVMNKMLAIGMKEEDVIHAVTSHPRKILQVDTENKLDLCILSKVNEDKVVKDIDGNEKVIHSWYQIDMVIKDENIIGVKNDDK